MGELEFHVIDFFLSPLLNEKILSKICRVQRKMIFFVGGFVRGVKEDFWKKIYLSIKIERLILFFLHRNGITN